MGENLKGTKKQEYNNRGDLSFVKTLINNMIILENIFNEKDDISLEEKVKINWDQYIKDNAYKIENIQMMLTNGIIESSNMKEYEFISQRDIFSINIREQYVILVYLKLMVMVWEKSEFMKKFEAKKHLDSILDELNCKTYLKLSDIEFLSKDISNIYYNRYFNQKSKVQILRNIYSHRIPMIKDKIEEITIHIKKTALELKKEKDRIT